MDRETNFEAKPNAVDVSISMSVHLGDMIRETAHLSVAEMGAHFRLAMAAWTRGGYLVGDPERLRRLAGVDATEWPAIWETLSELWTKAEDGRVFHARTLAELERAREKKASYQARGKQGGRPPKAEGHPKDKLPESSALATGGGETEAGQKTPPPPPPPSPSPDPENSPSARDPGTTEQGALPRATHGKPTPYNVVRMYLNIRKDLIAGSRGGISDSFANPQPSELEKAEKWLAGMTAEEAKFLEPAIRLACQHVVDGKTGWTHEAMTKSGFLLGSIVNSWRDLVEELQGCAPTSAADPKPSGRGPGGLSPALQARKAQLEAQVKAKTAGARQ